MQNENPAFVSLIGYSGLIFALFGDIYFFDIAFTATEIICAFFLICLTIAVIYMKLRS